MKKREKKRMAKATLRTPVVSDSRRRKQELRRAVREQKEIVALCSQLKRATDRADEKLSEVGHSLTLREERLGSAAVGH